MLQIIVAGLSHKTAPVEVRECFSLTQPAFDLGLSELYKKKNVQECLILSTCNRVEVYGVRVQKKLKRLFVKEKETS